MNLQYQFYGDIKYTELAFLQRKINISLHVQNLIVFSATSKCRIVQTNIFLKENLWNDEDLCICKIYDSEKYPPSTNATYRIATSRTCPAELRKIPQMC